MMRRTMRTINTPAIITSIRAKVDHSLSFGVTTPELTNEEKVAFMELQGINTTMTIVPLDEQNVPEIKVRGDLDQKSQSQRLRSTLFVLWEQEGRKGDFEDMYKNNMEKFINLVKDKLE
jgi:hypothetical protein